MVDYMLLDYESPEFAAQFRVAGTMLRHIKTVITNVPDMNTYNTLKSGQAPLLFTGDFYSQPITEGDNVISPLKVNALNLLHQVNQEDFDLTDIVKIIERDPYMSISLLKFINSGAVGLKRHVESINNAVAILGQTEVKKWSIVALSISLAEDRPSEITRISLIRAKFAENLATAFEMGVFQQGLFMAGLFSLLDVILEKPMEEAIKEVGVDERIRKALVDKQGDFYKVLELVYAYERADWDLATILMLKNDLEVNTVSSAFTDALLWYTQLLQSIDNTADEEVPV
ncbi:MAG: EAL and HDOD domain-containing protein [Christensenellaceae bacterium]|jgi:c-di-GMP-related signal transduction protein